jgi:nicotinamidase-related amidase
MPSPGVESRRHVVCGLEFVSYSGIALLIVDMVNDFEFEGSSRWIRQAIAAARAIAALSRRARHARVPVIYVNDNFGKWRSDFRILLEHCLHDDVRGKPLAELVAPSAEDYFVLKPKHSGFHSTTLDVLLAYLRTRTLILTGVAGNNCVLFTAHDAYMRDFDLLVPSDCVASPTAADNRYAIAHMSRVLKARTTPSRSINLAARRPARKLRGRHRVG